LRFVLRLPFFNRFTESPYKRRFANAPENGRARFVLKQRFSELKSYRAESP